MCNHSTAAANFSRRQILQLGCGAAAGGVALGVLGGNASPRTRRDCDLRLRCPADPGFGQIVDGIASSFRSAPLYFEATAAGFLLTDLGTRAVRAFATVWKLEAPPGEPLYFRFNRYRRLSASNYATARRPVLESGETGFFAPALSLRTRGRAGTVERSPSFRPPPHAAVFLSHVCRGSRVEGSIDDVIYADGFFAGTGASGLRERLIRVWDAERATAAALLHSPALRHPELWRTATPFLQRLAEYRELVGQPMFELRLERLAGRSDLVTHAAFAPPLRCAWAVRGI